jgi:ParB family transcriptional regulator, chromosome partitioning protein
LARTDFRAAAARRLSEERELSPAIVSLLSNDRQGRSTGGVRIVDVDRITPNPEQPRLAMDATQLEELAASIREHGVLQPILVRPLADNEFQLIAGERRWRASMAAGMATIPALVEDIDDDTALEISIIENLQREDLSPLDEAAMYDRMVREHGYSVRKLAQKLGKDKGYLENRLRLADAPPEIRELVSLRKDTLSAAYELMKVDDQRKRKRLAAQVGRGELTLTRLKEKIEGRSGRRPVVTDAVNLPAEIDADETDETASDAEAAWTGRSRTDAGPLRDDALVSAKQQLSDAVEAVLDVLRVPDVVSSIGTVDRSNLAKYLTIAKLRLENAIAMVRSEGP